MTKRFKLIGDSNLEVLMQHQLELPIYDYNNKKKRLSLNTTLNLLNSLYEENEQLKQRLNDFKYEIHRLKHELKCAVMDTDVFTNTQLKEKNEQLKKENQSLQKTISHVDEIAHEDRDYAKQMHKENEQLKEQNRQLRLENSKLTHVVFWTNKKNEEKLG